MEGRDRLLLVLCQQVYDLPQHRAGVPVKVVSERVGHSDPAITMQVYPHALEGDDTTAAETTATAIFGP